MMNRYATVEWGGGKRHLYAWESVRTLCGKEVPGSYEDVGRGGITYEAVSEGARWSVVSCSNCTIAATEERLAEAACY